ncbi:hypothetical protein [Streptomyces sp. NPDC001914]|uniref:hypothetical protein n=1 Tax=Streptomyces sp. NPDC001914 TaxID=3364623 RepID=UPI00367D97D9
MTRPQKADSSARGYGMVGHAHSHRFQAFRRFERHAVATLQNKRQRPGQKCSVSRRVVAGTSSTQLAIWFEAAKWTISD